MDKIKKKKEGPIAAFFKCGNSSTPKNAAIHNKNAALDIGYSRTYKMQLHMNNLSRVFKKRGLMPPHFDGDELESLTQKKRHGHAAAKAKAWAFLSSQGMGIQQLRPR